MISLLTLLLTKQEMKQKRHYCNAAPEVHGEDIRPYSSELHDDVVWVRGVHDLEVLHRGLEKSSNSALILLSYSPW